MRPLVRPAAWCLPAACALLIAACGGSDHHRAHTPRRVSAPPQPLELFSSLPLVGPSAWMGREVKRGIELALAQAQDRAGQYTVHLRSLNDARLGRGPWAAGVTAANARHAAIDPAAIAYIGELDPSATRISLPIVNQAGIPQVSPWSPYVGLTRAAPAGATAPGDPARYYPTSVRTFLRLAPDDEVQAGALLTATRDAGCSRLAVLRSGNPHDYSAELNALVGLAHTRFGVQIVSSAVVPGAPVPASGSRSGSGGAGSAGSGGAGSGGSGSGGSGSGGSGGSGSGGSGGSGSGGSGGSGSGGSGGSGSGGSGASGSSSGGSGSAATSPALMLRRYLAALHSLNPRCVVYLGNPSPLALATIAAVHIELPQASLIASDRPCQAAFGDVRLRRLLATAGGGRLQCTLPALPPNGPASGHFLSQWQIEYGGQPPRGPWAAYGYETTRLILSAIAGLGDQGDQRGKLRSALFAARRRDTLLGSYAFDARGDSTVRAYGLWQIRFSAPPRLVRVMEPPTG